MLSIINAILLVSSASLLWGVMISDVVNEYKYMARKEKR